MNLTTKSFKHVSEKIIKTLITVNPQWPPGREGELKAILQFGSLAGTRQDAVLVACCLVPIRRLTRPPRSMHLGDVSKTNGRETIFSDQVT